MTSLQQGVLTLIKSGLTGRAMPLPADFHIEDAARCICKHQVTGLCYEGAVFCGVDKTLPAMQELFGLSCRLLLCSEKQTQALKKLFAAFEEAGIDYLPVKGTVLRQLYPRPELRVMGDADVLIRTHQYEQISAIMQAQQYTCTQYTGNVYVWESPALTLELHETLVPADEQEYHYYEHLWDRAVFLEGHRYSLTPEEAYIFNFIHYVKHYRHGGIGLRQLTDLWLCEEQWDMDWDRIRTELEKLQLLTFWNHTRTMLENWFAEGPETEITEFMTAYIFESGSWGTFQNSAAATALLKSRQAGSVRRARMQMVCAGLFPNLEWMKKRYKILEKAPVLLPIMWPVRWVDAALFRRQNIQSNKKKIASAGDDQVEAFQQMLVAVGLEQAH